MVLWKRHNNKDAPAEGWNERTPERTPTMKRNEGGVLAAEAQRVALVAATQKEILVRHDTDSSRTSLSPLWSTRLADGNSANWTHTKLQRPLHHFLWKDIPMWPRRVVNLSNIIKKCFDKTGKEKYSFLSLLFLVIFNLISRGRCTLGNTTQGCSFSTKSSTIHTVDQEGYTVYLKSDVFL